MHWPQRWAEKNLPSLQRLKRNGLYFNRAYTAACQCSPSRAVMLTSRFAPINRVTRTFLWPGLQHKDRQPNIASLLKNKAGYEVIWKGKWHLSYGVERLAGQERPQRVPDLLPRLELARTQGDTLVADAVREGHRASAWFAHRRWGEVCHVEARGPDWKGSLAGGTKTLFPFGTYGPVTRRTVVTEA